MAIKTETKEATYKLTYKDLPKGAKITADNYGFPLPFDPNVGEDPFREIGVAPEIQDIDEEFKEKNAYKNNVLLKNKGVKMPFTMEMLEEIVKCKNDVLYFLENYAEITNLDEGVQKFKPFQYQKNMIKLMHENRSSIFLLSRQSGKCVIYEVVITVRHKITGVEEDIMIGEFYKRHEKALN